MGVAAEVAPQSSQIVVRTYSDGKLLKEATVATSDVAALVGKETVTQEEFEEFRSKVKVEALE